LLAGWAAIATFIGYWLIPGQLPPPESANQILAQAHPAAVTHTRASTQALIDATLYLTQLDQAMAQGVPILKANNLPELVTHSQALKALVEAGHAQFGRSVFEPLGRCGSAGVFANSWWQTQVSAARQGGIESIPGPIQRSLDEYTINRAECLKQATPSLNVVT
jgi:hypothetical protein